MKNIESLNKSKDIDWHTGIPTEEGLYVTCVLKYFIDNNAQIIDNSPGAIPVHEPIIATFSKSDNDKLGYGPVFTYRDSIGNYRLTSCNATIWAKFNSPSIDLWNSIEAYKDHTQS